MWSGSEAAHFEQRSGDVVVKVAEAGCGTAEVFEAPIGGFRGAVAGAGAVEENGTAARIGDRL